MNTVEIARSFSSHRFDDVFDRLAPTVRWVIPGQPTIEGRDSVVEACRAATAGFGELERVDFVRFVSVGDDLIAAVDVIARYLSTDGSVSVVSSADIYEFDGDQLVSAITSYAVELSGEPDGGAPD